MVERNVYVFQDVEGGWINHAKRCRERIEAIGRFLVEWSGARGASGARSGVDEG